MLTSTALKNPLFLARIKDAVVQAVQNAKAYPLADAGNGQPGSVKVGFRDVTAKRTGKLSLMVVFHRGQGLEFIDAHDRDVTTAVLTALRQYHANLRALVAKPFADIDEGRESFPYGRQALGSPAGVPFTCN